MRDKMFFNSQNIKLMYFSKKLNLKYYDFYKIIALIGEQVYQLLLPNSMKIHNLFHISLLKPCNMRDKILSSSPINIKEEKKYKVKKTLNNYIYYSKLQYFVK